MAILDPSSLRKPLSIRERLALYLILMAVRMLAPWEYEHQFKEVVGDIGTIWKEGA